MFLLYFLLMHLVYYEQICYDKNYCFEIKKEVKQILIAGLEFFGNESDLQRGTAIAIKLSQYCDCVWASIVTTIELGQLEHIEAGTDLWSSTLGVLNVQLLFELES